MHRPRNTGGINDGAADLRVAGDATAYRLLDVGYSISLDRARELLAASAPERIRPGRSEAAALQIKSPPLSLLLGHERLVVGGREYDAEVAARIYDFGAISLRVRVLLPGPVLWHEYVTFGRALDANEELQQFLESHARRLFERLGAAVERPRMASVREDYVVFRLREVRHADGIALTSAALLEAVDVAPLLLNESRTLHPDARAGLLQHSFSYYPDDLAILTWDNALVLDPSGTVTDVEYILEFANAQLLELRYYDAVLDDELQQLYERMQTTRRRRLPRLSRRYSQLLGDIQRLFTDSTELVERVENSLKVTDDVFLGRVYSAALEIFRGRAWRDGVYRKLTLVRESYEMLSAEAQASRSEVLELAIVLLIVFEIVMALAR
jgi:hypothetical protein